MEPEVKGVRRSSWLFDERSCDPAPLLAPEASFPVLLVTSSFGSCFRESLEGGTTFFFLKNEQMYLLCSLRGSTLTWVCRLALWKV